MAPPDVLCWWGVDGPSWMRSHLGLRAPANDAIEGTRVVPPPVSVVRLCLTPKVLCSCSLQWWR